MPLSKFDLDRIHADIAQAEEMIMRLEVMVDAESDPDEKAMLQASLGEWRQTLAQLNGYLS